MRAFFPSIADPAIKLVETTAINFDFRHATHCGLSIFVVTMEDHAMHKNKLTGLILLIIGASLIYLGLNQAESPLGELNEALTGSYSDETLAYLLAGIIACVAGSYQFMKK